MSLMPKTNDKYVGVEIEFITPLTAASVERLIRKHKLNNNVTLTYDGSVKVNGAFGHESCPLLDSYGDVCEVCRGLGVRSKGTGLELQVLSKQEELKPLLSKLDTLFTEASAEVNNTCGLHVHLDMRNRKFTDSVTKLLNVQSLMLKSVPKSRRINQYCRPVNVHKVKDLGSISKYHTIHTEDCMQEYSTVEVRVHEGTIDTKAIFNWVRFLINTVDGNFAMRQTRSTKALPIRLQKYMENRIAANE